MLLYVCAMRCMSYTIKKSELEMKIRIIFETKGSWTTSLT